MFLPIIINEIEDCDYSEVEVVESECTQNKQKPKSKFRQLFCRHNYNQCDVEKFDFLNLLMINKTYECTKCGKYKTTLHSISKLK